MNGVLTSKSILWSGSGNTWEDGSLWFWRHSPLKGAHSTYQSNQILGNNGARCALRNTLRIEMSFYEGIKAFLWTYLEPLPLVIWFCCQHFTHLWQHFPPPRMNENGAVHSSQNTWGCMVENQKSGLIEKFTWIRNEWAGRWWARRNVVEKCQPTEFRW